MIADELTIVAFSAKLDTFVADNRIVELSLDTDVNIVVGDIITKVDTLDLVVGGELDGIGVGVAVTPITCLLTLRFARFLWAPDITCHPTTGTPSRVLMVPSWASASSLERGKSPSLIAPHPISHVSKLLDPLANLPSPAPAAITAGLSS